MACPSSGTPSKRVGLVTVKSLVRQLPFGMPRTQYFFCDSAACDVVYFPLDASAPVFRCRDLLVPVGAKQPSASGLLCYCFGVTRGQVEEELRKDGKCTVLERIRAEVKAGNCACEWKNPSGKCCLGSIARAIQDFNRKSGFVPG
jgi:hypothetical protein